MEKQKLEAEVLKEGYTHLKWVKDSQGKEVLCGLFRFIFTVGLVIDIDTIGYKGRYCFPDTTDAKITITSLSSIPENIEDFPGHWIKYKGEKEVRNEKYRNFVE